MSKQSLPNKAKSVPPKGEPIIEPPVKASGTLERVSTPLTCSDCQFWFRTAHSFDGQFAGQCRVNPPDQVTDKFLPGGRILTYRHTLDVLPMCGSFKSL